MPLWALLAVIQEPVPHDAFETRLVAWTQKVLPAMDAPAPYVLEWAGPILRSTGERVGCSACTFRSSDGARFEAYLQQDEGRYSVVRADARQGGAIPRREKGSRTPHEQRARAAAVMARLDAPHRLRLEEDLHGWRYAEDRLWFAILVRGHPFLDSREAGYGMRLDAKTGAVLSVEAHEALPEFDRSPPRLKGDDALAVARRLLVGDPRPQRTDGGSVRWREYVLDPSSPYFSSKRTPYRRRLGWRRTAGTTQARLAWALPYFELYHVEGPHGGGIKGGLSELAIDAVSGEPLPLR